MSQSDEKASYRQIMKATSIFGGVQVFNIIIAIIRSKVVALLLGPAGMGVFGLFTTTIGMISSLTNFGLGTSAVREIAEANAENNEDKIGKTIAVFRNLVWITGGLGALLTLIFSPLLSELTFGNKNYTWSFVFLSISLLVTQLVAGQNVLLQGTRQLKFLAFANMFGSVASLFIALPLYFFYKEKGIVPAIIFMGLVSYIVALNFSRKIKIKKVSVSIRETFEKGKGMLQLGIMLSLSGIVSTIVSYLVRIYISNTGSLKDVGLYTAGFQIISIYVGLVFTAMGTDYFPRLSGVANDNEKRNALVNQQGEIAILILFPIILVFIVFIPFIIKLLYSSQFLPIDQMIVWGAFSMLFKAGSWAMAFQFLAKGGSRLFFVNELATNIYMLIFNMIGYHYFGLTGLGYSFLLTYVMYILQVYLLTSKNYQYAFNDSFLKTFLLAIFISGICLAIVLNASNFYKYLFGVILILGASVFSIYQLDTKTGILGKLVRRKQKS